MIINNNKNKRRRGGRRNMRGEEVGEDIVKGDGSIIRRGLIE